LNRSGNDGHVLREPESIGFWESAVGFVLPAEFAPKWGFFSPMLNLEESTSQVDAKFPHSSSLGLSIALGVREQF